jgi:chaperonin cofactor prefoldin
MITRENDTLPAPVDPAERLASEVGELKLALMRVGEILAKVNHTVTMIELAERTAEHRINTLQDVADAQDRQIAALDQRLKVAGW